MSSNTRISKLINFALIVGVSLLLLAGFINLKIARSKTVSTQAMLLGSTTDQPLFYLKQFVFPELIEIPYGSTHTERYLEAISLLPPSPEIIKAGHRDINNNDSVIIQYTGNDSRNVFKCDGTPLNSHEPTQSLYFINTLGDLACAEIVDHQPDLSHSQVVVKNMNVLRILYGIDTNNDQISDIYVSANSPDFSLKNIAALKVIFLLKTFEKESVSPQTYTLADEQVGPYTDGYRRKVLTLVLPTKSLQKTESILRTPS
jgi:hypothetical protein